MTYGKYVIIGQPKPNGYQIVVNERIPDQTELKVLFVKDFRTKDLAEPGFLFRPIIPNH